jgi:hypothetical protein
MAKATKTVRFDPVTTVLQIDESDEWTISRKSVPPNYNNAENKDMTGPHIDRSITIWWLRETRLTFIERRWKDLFETMKKEYYAGITPIQRCPQNPRKRSLSEQLVCIH